MPDPVLRTGMTAQRAADYRDDLHILIASSVKVEQFNVRLATCAGTWLASQSWPGSGARTALLRRAFYNRVSDLKE